MIAIAKLPARVRRALPYVVPAAVFLAVLLAMFWRIWTPIDGARRAFGWDAQWEYWGDLQFQLDALRDGELPLWNPFDRAGYPFHADPQAGILYPVTWLLLGIGLLLGSTPWWLIAVKTILHFWIGSLGVYAFLRRRGNPIAACYAGGFLFVFTYPFMHNSFSALNWSMAWAPWALLAVDAWSERPTSGRAAWIALALGMGHLAGAMASFWYTLLVVGPYAIWALVHHARAASDRRAYLRAASVSGAIALALFLALIAAQFLSTQALVPHTVRDVRDLNFVATTAFTPDDLIGFLIPRFPGENCYVGFAALAWAAICVSIRPNARAFVLAGVALLGVLCAWGNLGPFLPFEASVLPTFGFFRRAHRYLYVTVLALSILSAEGLGALMELKGRALRRRVALSIGAAALVLAIVLGVGFVIRVTTPHKTEEYRDAYAYGFVAVAIGAWITILVAWIRGPWRRKLAAIGVAILGLDLAMAQTPKLELNLFEIPKTPHDAQARSLAGVPLEARIYDREHFKHRPGIRLGVRDLGGYEGDPLSLRRYAELLKAAQAKPPLLAHAGVRWLTESAKTRTKPTEVPKNELRAVAGKRGIYEVPDAVPTVLWFDGARLVDDAAQALAILRGARPGTVALLERPTLDPDDEAAAADDSGLPPIPGRVVEWGRNRIVVEIDAPEQGFVVIHEAYYPGWTATVDGAPRRVVAANSLFRAVRVDKGRHRIVLTYRATRFVALAIANPLAIAAAAFLIARERRRRRRDSAGGVEPAERAPSA